ncbi:MAG: hypothetical protein A3E07_03835 [Candidatus Wildermuthbacteria bacterium RIFCSPHIGHO2_12_FULL_45_9]|uniref:Uncharacterized protein n=1 Tax=Candidatus Wildermuthbacteria bacterium RIFCSPHIGHO2_02_FULL_45_25 TaxID=1802450 RepID=A0A1G2R2W4_9BACT|nr:MAG: hypothetical protein A2748_02330 [Candidatus Wildermuthbacteria bacterium RIFCSPHIGHO2_01_FULL_45_20]OHA67224.1 MAG: hypothetical protein A3C04_01675 [Candidatus Wildermuthbacteria bacterium RIFCSPHIGHO2_02_FULL_45_25]OHA71897.1 MAG: hypothetical protein A3E07_03835 [Candidatus Wildermuthbacteria bacterium RIFCSPHIGHO2_12_FULL_45_9]
MDFSPFSTALFWFVVASVFAAIEIEIEGKHGWAEKTPTWFRTKGAIAKTYGFFMGGKPLTGYHLFMFILPILIMHAHFAMGASWSLSQELLVWAIYFAWMPTWDFLWFVLNPHYGVKGFRKNNVWWHAQSHWLFGFTPLDYIAGWGVSIFFAVAASFVINNTSLFFSHLVFLGCFILFTLATIFFFAPLYKRWYKQMRTEDHRSESRIFHKER